MKPLALALANLLIGAMLTASSAVAQDYPSRPVRIIYGFAAGGGGDSSGRALAQGLTTALGVPFVFENKPGANGAIAAGQVAAA